MKRWKENLERQRCALEIRIEVSHSRTEYMLRTVKLQGVEMEKVH